MSRHGRWDSALELAEVRANGADDVSRGGSASVLRGYHNSPWYCLSAWTYELVASLGGLSGAWNAWV